MSNPWLFGDSRSCRLSSLMEINRLLEECRPREYDLLTTEVKSNLREKSEMETSSLTDVLKRLVPALHVALQPNDTEQCEKMEVDDDDEISGTPEAAGIRTVESKFPHTPLGTVTHLKKYAAFLNGFGGVVVEMKMPKEVTKEIEKLEAKNNRLEMQLREKTELIQRYQDKMEQMTESIAVITDLEPPREPSQIKVNYNGVLVWKIEGYQRKRQDAINGIKTALYSPYFYTSEFGYKMCAKMYDYGDGFGKGTHLSLFLVVMKGEYDALQTWPMQKKFTVILLDQGNGDHKIDVFHSDPQNSSFQRPTSDMNIAFCSPLFMNIPLDSLNDHQYIKDDVMFIRIIVE